MNITLYSPGHPSWNSMVDHMGLRLGAPDNPTLFPYHFLAVVLQRIGGHLVQVEIDGDEASLGFLFPRHAADGPAYTLRHHPLRALDEATVGQIVATVSSQLSAAVRPYDPLAPLAFEATTVNYGAVEIGRPTAEEAAAVRRVQQTVWGSPPEFLYPVDIHSREFDLPTSLVARVDGQLAGFLFGVDKFGGPPLPTDWHERFNGARRIESQTMGVLPEFRGMRIGFLLKKAQAELAWAQGVGIINWTVDPLQFPNAALNFGLLRAVAYDFYPDLYPFRNELNRVHASRFAITWPIGTRHVQDVPIFGSRALILDLNQHPNIAHVNHGWTDVNYTLTNAVVAIEIPANWTALQSQDLDEAVAWRATTDRIFERYLGRRPGQYVITGVGVAGERRFLVAQRVDDGLWENLGRSATPSA